jgi:hypothetical protein
MKSLQAWHGSHRWQNPPEIRSPRAGCYEHGCGIYLTNIWDTAAKYAKGGGSILKITLEVEDNYNDHVSLEEAVDFIKTCPALKQRSSMISYLTQNQRTSISAIAVNNLCVNAKALTTESARHVARWLTEHGTPYSISHIKIMDGIHEEWMVIFDPSIIRTSIAVPTKELDKLNTYDDRHFPTFSNQLSNQPEMEPTTLRM